MTMREFIRLHRETIDGVIDARLDFVSRTASCSCPKSGTDHYHNNGRKHNDEERRGWVLNDESLYLMARSEGVQV
jgi:hypothetical protein